MLTRTEPNVSILRDLIYAAFVASLTLGAWVGVFTWFGNSSKLDTGFITLLGGVLAVSGLLFRQYMFKEVLDYLKAWEKLSNLLREIIENASKQGHDKNTHIKDFISQETLAHKYSKYIRRELALVPIVPIILIFLYGCALLSERSLLLREICIFLMIHLVSYLAIAAVTSTSLACAYPDLEKMIAELETLRSELEPTKQVS